jgi:YkoY family integral membrane protein
MSFLEELSSLLQQIMDHPLPSALVVINLILIESLLSVDNAAVLATMVMDLPKDQRRKALRYGIIGAYLFRGLALLFAAWLVQFWWVKPVGGIYLLLLALRYFFRQPAREPAHHEDVVEKERTWFYRKTLGVFGPFWSTVILVELMDMAFSIDNVIAANAYTSNIILIWVGVFIGILAMRFVAQGFVRLMERYPFLEFCAYLVIGLLGVKLLAGAYTHFEPCSELAIWLEGDLECRQHRGLAIPEGYHPRVWGDWLVSAISMAIFFVPIITSWLLGWPRHKK